MSWPRIGQRIRFSIPDVPCRGTPHRSGAYYRGAAGVRCYSLFGAKRAGRADTRSTRRGTSAATVSGGPARQGGSRWSVVRETGVAAFVVSEEEVREQ